MAFRVYDLDNDEHLNREELKMFQQQMWSLKDDTEDYDGNKAEENVEL